MSATTDQGLFAAYILLAYHVGLRLAWFPGCNHQDSNALDSTMAACGLDHLDAKVRFLARFNYGPIQKSLSASGHWFGVQKHAAEALDSCHM